MAGVKVKIVGIGVGYLNPSNVVNVLPAVESGRVLLGHATIVTVNGPPMRVEGIPEQIARELWGPMVDLQGGN